MYTPKISVVVALSENRVIGKDNKLPWRISEDMQHFKEITTGHVVIMGRKTFASIGRLLPLRMNIIVSRDLSYTVEGATMARSLEQAVEIAKNYEQQEICIIGGGQVFEEAMPLVDILHLTIIHAEIDGDVYFPDYSAFKKVVKKEDGASGGYTYTFLDLEKE